MLRAALARLSAPPLRIYVGVYPNDPATINAVALAAAEDPRIRMVVHSRAGPTTKADNLNSCWRALMKDESANAVRVDAIVLHDAEDVVHAGKLSVYAHWLATHDAVQIPVMPLPDPNSRLVAGSYIEEFAEAHGKELVVRQALGAGLPFAGTGCAVRRAMLVRVAEARGGLPFDAESLTEDYELGLTIAALGGKTALAWVIDDGGRIPVAVRAYFPGRLDAAIRQKSRWMVGIALAGWDRVGWGRPLAFAEHWMRMRDRRAPVAVLVLFAGYCALFLWAVSFVVHALSGVALAPIQQSMQLLLAINAALLGWRIAMRIAFVVKAEGWREGLRAVPRLVVANLIAMLAVQRALVRYVAMLRGSATRWDKTTHHFPAGVS